MREERCCDQHAERQRRSPDRRLAEERRQIQAAKPAKGDVPRTLTEIEQAEIKAFGAE